MENIKKSFLRVAEIDLDAYIDNILKLKRAIAPKKLLCVLKADAYGHGSSALAIAVQNIADYIGVATLQEAALIRKFNKITPILVWQNSAFDNFEDYIYFNLTAGISNIETLNSLADTAAKNNYRFKVHLFFDTGLGREGYGPNNWHLLLEKAKEYEMRGFLEVEGIFSHMSNTSLEDDLCQIDKFKALKVKASDAGLSPALCHIAASGAGVDIAESRFDMIRAGIASYGILPDDMYLTKSNILQSLNITPIMCCAAYITQIKDMPKGHGVSYGYRYTTKCDTRLAVVPFGYAEGLSRLSATILDNNELQISINGKFYNIAGTIAMDQFIIDIGKESDIKIGDKAIIFGNPLTGEPDINKIAKNAQTISYEILSKIGKRAQKIYSFKLNLENIDIFCGYLAKFLKKGDILALYGNLGSGKTTFIRHLANHLGVKQNIASPTFGIEKIYSIPAGQFNHIDAYRLESQIDFDALETDFENSISAIEWPKHFIQNLRHQKPNLRKVNIGFEYIDETIRQISFWGDNLKPAISAYNLYIKYIHKL